MINTGRSGTARRTGFTLLELLVAMSLISLVLVLLYSGFRLGIGSWNRGQAVAERMDELRLAQEFLRRQLRQSVTVFRTDPDQGRTLYFLGHPNRIGWVAPMLNYLDLGGLYYMELDRVGDPDAGQLRIRWFPYHPGEADDVIDSDGAEQTLLLEDVGELKIEYFGTQDQQRQDEEPEWHDEWENEQLRPALVRLSIEVPDFAWPPLTVVLTN